MFRLSKYPLLLLLLHVPYCHAHSKFGKSGSDCNPEGPNESDTCNENELLYWHKPELNLVAEDQDFRSYTILTEESLMFGTPQQILGDGKIGTANAVTEMITYMNTIAKNRVSSCQNTNKLCCFWASRGDCRRGDTVFMKKSCGPCCKSCGLGDIDDNVVNDEVIPTKVITPDYDENSYGNFDVFIDELLEEQIVDSLDYPLLSLRSKDYGVRQAIEEDEEEGKETAVVVSDMINYMTDLMTKIVSKDPQNKISFELECRNKKPLCCFWASIGECENTETESYMQENCGPCCKSCDHVEFENDFPKYSQARAIEGGGESDFPAATSIKTDNIGVQVDEVLDYSLLSTQSEEYGVNQAIEDGGEATSNAVQEMITYMENMIADTTLSDPEFLEYLLNQCQNKEDLCCFWASIGECEKTETQGYMYEFCGPCCKSCKLTYDFNLLASQLPDDSQKYGVKQVIEDDGVATSNAVQQMITYMENMIADAATSDPEFPERLLYQCRNKEDLCCFWASIGECEKTETQGYMYEFCGPCCKSCKLTYDFNLLASQLPDDSQKYGVKQVIEDDGVATSNAVQQMITYMENMIADAATSDPEFPERLLDQCRNEEDLCCFWASIGECEKTETQGYMYEFCGPCCKACNLEDLQAESQLSDDSQKYGVKQVIEDDGEATSNAVQEMITYMENMIADATTSNPEFPERLLYQCRNEEDLCCFWASIGDCEKTETQGYMYEFCGPCCKACNLEDLQAESHENDEV